MCGAAVKSVEWMMARVKMAGDCWEWTSGKNSKGYGRVHATKLERGAMAHRVMYELVRGPIPEGLTLDHLCRNRACVNPDHLEAVTNRLNIIRGSSPAADNANKATCLRGHALSGRNVWIAKDGSRVCKECQRVRRLMRRHGVSVTQPGTWELYG